ncbi:restriction endonuclease [Peribacillus frigoritolerans]|uniref:Restriction endonuclease n=1 Tax=Peribacillus frigoritolerans TaxID=450367 RepID=A0AAJ1QLW6_9BACI|nr:restriction endonuclease [Peribacillus frigoritolerans]MDM5283778.1 restriction endonuclease [Peribacillus frigoritolerans]
MSTLNYFERSYFEDLFGMQSGYVLDFSNREFQDFVIETIQIDIYTNYSGLSKAKILREIMKNYNDTTVGKLLLSLLEYMRFKKLVSSEDSETFRKCAEIGQRLIGKTIKNQPPKPKTDYYKNNYQFKRKFDSEKYLSELRNLISYASPQSRGFAFEKYLKNLFLESGMEPRGSFKLVGEQIDGSFTLDSAYYLLEAKWTNKPIDKSNLVIFNEKVVSKSGFTRGLFISYAGYTDEALKTFDKGRIPNIVLMTIQELAICLERNIDIKEIIRWKVRTLAEEGLFYKDYSSNF